MKTSRKKDAAWVREVAMKRIALGLLASVMAIAATTAIAQSNPPLKLGAILDMSGLYADITGSGSETAAKMAAEDFGGEVLGRKIEIIAADHLNKGDLSANIARDMLDNQASKPSSMSPPPPPRSRPWRSQRRATRSSC